MSGIDHMTTIAQERAIAETISIYDNWAEVYNKDAENSGFIGWKTTATLFDSLGLPKTSKIIDIGAGTGNIGEYLKQHGYADLHALDGSEKMLDIAKKRGIYKTMTQALLGAEHTIPLTSDCFDAAIMAGIFSPGHVGPDAFPEIIRLVKPGGLVCWGMRAPHLYADRSDIFKGDFFHKSVMALCKSGKWEIHEGPIHLENYNETMPGLAYIMRVL